ncbi:MAG: SAM-dependent methyltransferase [Halodesulfurarchaeum sp.]
MEALARYEPIVPNFDRFLSALKRPLPTTVRVNGIKADRETAIDALLEADVSVRPREWNPSVLELGTEKPGNTWPYVHGWIHGQEDVSTVPPLVVDPEPGAVVWAAAAAPGGKATQLADLMDDRGLVIANDDNLGRLSALRTNADRLGVTSMAVTNQDARHFSVRKFPFDEVDHSLVDAPCTGEGTLRKAPDALAGTGGEASRTMAEVQRDILERAVRLTTPGGTVVYSTCTFAPEENEGVVDHVLSRTDCRIEPFDVGLDHDPGITEWREQTYANALSNTHRYYPHRNDTGGFYVAKLVVTG